MTTYQEALTFLLDPARVTLRPEVSSEQIEKMARKYAAGWRTQASASFREPTRYPVPKWARVQP
jgi:hypothetical protein